MEEVTEEMTTGQAIEEFLQTLRGDIYSEPPSELHEQVIPRMVDWALQWTELKSPANILDLGAGQGQGEDEFLRRGFNRLDFITINADNGDNAACVAKGYVGIHYDIHEWVSNCLIEPSFDMVWARHIIEHSPIPMFAIHHIHRILKPGGWFYMEVPMPGTACCHERNPNHYSVFTKEVWYALLSKFKGLEFKQSCDIDLQTGAGPDQYHAFLMRKSQ